MSTVGVMWLAYCIPNISCLPPAPESPVAGSNTPIFTTFSPEAASELLWLSLLASLELSAPQAARLMDIASASMMETNFFIQFILLARSGLLKASALCRWMYFMQIQYRSQEKIRTKSFLRFSQAFHQMTIQHNQMYLTHGQIGRFQKMQLFSLSVRSGQCLW